MKERYCCMVVQKLRRKNVNNAQKAKTNFAIIIQRGISEINITTLQTKMFCLKAVLNFCKNSDTICLSKEKEGI